MATAVLSTDLSLPNKRTHDCFGVFWASGGDPKITPKAVPSLALTTRGRHLVPFWSFQRSFLDFGCILGSFWAPPGLIFDQF